jgi:uncharacterized membrane protein YfcA
VTLLAVYLLAGVAAGFVSGLFGLGGGLTIVPALAFAPPREGVASRYVMHLAINTSLVVMVVTALTVLRHRRGDLDWPLFGRLARLPDDRAWRHDPQALTASETTPHPVSHSTTGS